VKGVLQLLSLKVGAYKLDVSYGQLRLPIHANARSSRSQPLGY
jgi:hypothetical protein